MDHGAVILRFDDVSFDYGHLHPILEEASFSIRENAKLTIVGQNGAGKSTIFKMMTGELKPTDGEIHLKRKATIGIAKQVVSPEDLERNVQEFFEHAFDEKKYDIERDISRVLDVVNLVAPRDKKIAAFSGGQKARLLLAYAIIQEPDILLLDEPTNNLDKEGIDHLTGFLVMYPKTCIVISHDADFLNSFTHGVLHLDQHTKTVQQYVGDYFDVVEEIEKQGAAAVSKIQNLNNHGVKIIAEKVETHEQFERFKDMGVKLFQGYFLARPEMIRHRDLNASLHSVTELVSLSNSPNFDVKEVTKVIEHDVGLAYKLMRFVNNPLINKRQKIESLQHALNYMGHIEIKKFIALLALANLRGEKPGELLIQSLVRARFCSLMSVELELPENPPSSFLLGLFSMLDALLDQPMESLVQKLPVGEELQDALCRKNTDSNMGLQLRACFAFEEANWDEIDYIAEEFEITGERLYTLYYEAMHWAQNMSTSLI